jgi:hypothetical protein
MPPDDKVDTYDTFGCIHFRERVPFFLDDDNNIVFQPQADLQPKAYLNRQLDRYSLIAWLNKVVKDVL